MGAKKILAWICICLSIGIYVISDSESLMKWVAVNRYKSEAFWGSDHHRYGDLFGLCYLRNFKRAKESDSFKIPGPGCNKPRNINIYSLVDSYVFGYDFKEDIFCGVKSFQEARWYYDDRRLRLPVPDKTCKNIILICCNERNAFKYLADTQQIFGQLFPAGEPITYHYKKFWNKVYNYNLDENLEFNLFDYRFLTPVRELKADLNYHLFHRTDQQVVLSNDKQMLIFVDAMDSTAPGGYTYQVSDARINYIVNCLLKARKHYLKLGFDDVVINITPSPPAVIYENNPAYNHLLNRILTDPRIAPFCFNIRPAFNGTGELYFLQSDSHWNKAGFRIWVDGLNQYLLSKGYVQ